MVAQLFRLPLIIKLRHGWLSLAWPSLVRLSCGLDKIGLVAMVWFGHIVFGQLILVFHK